MYILCYYAKRKDAKRHIWGRYGTLDECTKNADNSNYTFKIYDSKWHYVGTIINLRYIVK